MYRQGQRPLTTLNLSYPLVHMSLHRVVRPRTTSHMPPRASMDFFPQLCTWRASNVQNGIHVEDIFFVVVELLPRCGGETYPRVSVVAKEWLSNYVTRVHVSARTVIWKYVSRFTQSNVRTSDEEDSSDAFFKTCLFVYKIMA